MATFQLYAESAAHARVFQVAAAAAGIEVAVSVVAPEDAGEHPVVGETPFASLPMLDTPKGSVSNTNAILKYIATITDAPHLLGAGVFGEADVCQWLEWVLTSLSPLLAVLSDPARASHAPDAAVAALKPRLAPLLAYVEAHLSTRTWLVGERLSLADISCAAALVGPWDGEIVGGKVTLPNVQRWLLTCRHQAPFVKVFGAAPGPLPAVPAFSLPPTVASASPAPAPSAPTGASSSASASSGRLTPAGALDLALSGGSVIGTGAHTVIPGGFNRRRARVSEVLLAGETLVGKDITVSVVCVCVVEDGTRRE